MKLLQLLVLACCSIIVVPSETSEPNNQALLARASAQLERLAPYRRTSPTDQRILDEQWRFLENVAKDPGIKRLSELQAFEIYRILPENLQQDIANKVGGNRAMIELLANSKYMAMMQDRIKRSGNKRETYESGGYESPPEGYPQEGYGGYAPESYGEHYGGYPQSPGSDSGGIITGSTSLISGIAKGIIGGLVSASGSASKGSSSISASSSQSSAQSSSSSTGYNRPKPEYGPVYSYGDKAFDVWDFKKAIISTLMQAVKAISGGVIALKGQLLKGSGYLVATKGRIITKAGDAVTNLGRNIAKSAVHPSPQPSYPAYQYNHPPEGHEETYDGPPPSIHEYTDHNEEYHGNSNYESPSDVDDQAGLLIVKPTKPDHDHDHDQHTTDLDAHKPSVTQTEDNYHGPLPELPDKGIENALIGNVNSYQHLDQADHSVEADHSPDHLPTSYQVPLHQNSLEDYAKGHHYPTYPPLASGSPLNLHSPLSVQQSIEYPPIHIQYVVPNKGNLGSSNTDTSSNDLSVYGSLSIGVDPEIESIKISTVKQESGHEFSKLRPHASVHDVPVLSNSYSTLQEPLRIPLLNPHSAPYWQNQALLQPLTNFDMHSWYRRRSGAQKRRSVSEVLQRMRRQRG